MKHNTAIHNALLKYGYSNFTLDILEYCEGVDPVLREQFYFETLKPEYNILQQAGSSLGFKHSEKTLEFFKNNREVSEETRKNLITAWHHHCMSHHPRSMVPTKTMINIYMQDNYHYAMHATHKKNSKIGHDLDNNHMLHQTSSSSNTSSINNKDHMQSLRINHLMRIMLD